MVNTKQYSPLKLENLTKRYGRYRGIKDVSLELKNGEVFGFLGPNGAGKTTAIRTIMNFLRPSHGQALVFGLDSVNQSGEIKALTGYLAGDFVLYGNLTGEQYLEFIANLRGCKNVKKQITELAIRLEADTKRKIATLSRGNMQKIALIAALLHDPQLLILDEPTTGLDPLVQNLFYELVKERVKTGKTVFMSSHILSEVQNICDRVAFMKEGRLIELIDVSKMQASSKKEVTISYKKPGQINMPPFDSVDVIEQDTTSLKFVTTESTANLLKWLNAKKPDDITIGNLSLDDMFLRLYGKHEELTHV